MPSSDIHRHLQHVHTHIYIYIHTHMCVYQVAKLDGKCLDPMSHLTGPLENIFEGRHGGSGQKYLPCVPGDFNSTSTTCIETAPQESPLTVTCAL